MQFYGKSSQVYQSVPTEMLQISVIDIHIFNICLDIHSFPYFTFPENCAFSSENRPKLHRLWERNMKAQQPVLTCSDCLQNGTEKFQLQTKTRAFHLALKRGKRKQTERGFRLTHSETLIILNISRQASGLLQKGWYRQ